jgi:dolichol-phosphate mannosyltransferase
MSDRILVFIPCYNCEKQIPRVIARCRESVADLISEIIVVDNGSRDGTVRAASEALTSEQRIPWKVVTNTHNYNLGGSHKVAFAYALEHQFTHVIALHGDDQADIADFAPLLRAGRHREVDALLGSRFMAGAELLGYGAFRRFGNLVFNALFTLVSGRAVKDIGSGLNLYGRKVFEAGDHRYAADDLTFNCFFLLRMIARDRHLAFAPIHWRESDQVSNAKLFRQAGKILKLLFDTLVSRKTLDVDRSGAGFTYQFFVAAEGGAR